MVKVRIVVLRPDLLRVDATERLNVLDERFLGDREPSHFPEIVGDLRGLDAFTQGGRDDIPLVRGQFVYLLRVTLSNRSR